MKKLLILFTATLICAAIPMSSSAQRAEDDPDAAVTVTITEKNGTLTISTSAIKGKGAVNAIPGVQIEGEGVRVSATQNLFPTMTVTPSSAVKKIYITVYFSDGTTKTYTYDSW